MDDEEFKKTVLDRFDTIDRRLQSFEEHMHSRMDALAQRIDDQDLGHDLLVGKVDRYAGNTAAALEAAEQALNRTTSLSRRLSRLEKPDDPAQAAPAASMIRGRRRAHQGSDRTGPSARL